LDRRGRKWWEAGEDYIIRSFITCTLHHIIVRGDEIKADEMGGACSTLGDRKNVYEIVAGKPEWNRLLGRPWHRWEYNIRIDCREIL
jgi:hypothetical protein